MEYYTDNTGNKSHNEELGGDLRNVVALCHNAPNRPYDAGSDRKKNQLMSQSKGRHLVVLLGKLFSVFLIGLVGNGKLRVFLDLYRITHRENDSKAGKEDPHRDTEPCTGHDRDP